MRRYCFNEFLIYIRKKPGIVILTILIGALGAALTLCTERLAGRAESENREYNRIYEDGKYSTLGDNFFDDVERELKAKPEYWNILKEFNEMLHTSEAFQYLEIRKQYSEVFDYRGKDENLSGYEYGDVQRVQQRGVDIFSNIKAVWLGEEVFEHFKLTASEGRLFEQDEYGYYFGKEQDVLMPVLMGSNFKGDYQVGDIIYVNNFVVRGEVQVIGFLEEGCSVYLLGTMEAMDRYLVFPMLRINDEPETAEERRLFRNLYYEKNNGQFYADIDEDDIQDIVTAECERLGIAGGYYVCGADNQPAADLGMSIDDIVKIIRYFAVGISIFSVLILLIYLRMKIKRSGRYYAVLLINGFTNSDIVAMIIAEAVLILGVSCVFGIMCGNLLCRILFHRYQANCLSLLLVQLISGVIVVVSSVYGYRKIDLSMHLGKEED